MRRMTGTEKTLLGLVGILVYLALLLPLSIWFGFAASHLWTWFIVPLGVPAIGVWHAAGISTLIGLFLSSIARMEGKLLIAASILTPAFALAFGAIYHAFM